MGTTASEAEEDNQTGGLNESHRLGPIEQSVPFGSCGAVGSRLLRPAKQTRRGQTDSKLSWHLLGGLAVVISGMHLEREG